ncbi:MAG TPA: hypothetical protein VKQ29_16770 [Aliidongia sp.]|nr:hypothetical protein [Aliidongia sp.]
MLTALLFASVAVRAETILRCEGYDPFYGNMVHNIDIDGHVATVDGTPYRVQSETPTSFTLWGPTDEDSASPSWMPPNQVMIDRVTGSYFMVAGDDPKKAHDWSRPKDRGCRKVVRKF